MKLLPSAQSVADDFADSPRWYRTLIRFRFLLAGIYLISAFVLIIWSSATIASDFIASKLLAFMLLGGFFFGGQAMLLQGAPQRRWKRPTHRRHIAASLIAGALLAGALSFGIAATVTSLLGHTLKWPGQLFGEDARQAVFVIGIPWVFWLIIFTLLWARRWSTGFVKMYRLLLAGTWIEILFTIPVDVAVRRRTNCYCDEGTFVALVIGVTAAFWTFGPGVVLLFLAVRLRRREKSGNCRQCGYNLRGLPSPRCPECGTPFDLMLLVK